MSNGAYESTPRQDPLSNRVRERVLQEYVTAVRTGNLDEQDRLLESFADDTTLIEAAWEVHVALTEETEAAATEAATARETATGDLIRDLAATNLDAPVVATRAEAEALQAARQREEEEALLAEPAPLTLRDVADRLRTDVADGLVERRSREVVLQAADKLARAEGELEPAHLTARGARSLLDRLGLASVVKWFQDAALSLDMARNQDAVRLAAARRQKQARPRPLHDTEPGGQEPGAEETRS